jgi:5-hydroxyisourate hydrolase-like protein (transthyretin family)
MKGFDDRGQIYTMEGFASALILIGVLLFIFQSISIVTPQTEKTMDMKLGMKATDALVCMDRIDEDRSTYLKEAVTSWNGGTATYSSHVSATEDGIKALDAEIASMLSPDVSYRVDLAYYDGVSDHLVPLILHGIPGDNSVVASRLVAMNEDDSVSAFWRGVGRYPLVAEIRLTCWYL